LLQLDPVLGENRDAEDEEDEEDKDPFPGGLGVGSGFRSFLSGWLSGNESLP